MKIEEILVLHHSHFDVGYTHTPPVIWELQREYIDQALDFLDQTADWPEVSRPAWTCEVTAPVMTWLEAASSHNIERFISHARSGRLGISAMEYNTTPLCSAEQLVRQLSPARILSERIGVRINTLNQHDVNGIPWTMVDLMIDSGIELLTMAINIHLGRAAGPTRPSIFRWQGPSGRDLLVMNGNHYTMFDQWFATWDYSVARMQEGLTDYLDYLKARQYPYSFAYLTTTNPPALWDNSPPNLQVATLIRRWNESGSQPPIRYATPQQLLARITAIPRESLSIYAGDWTDYWNFGCASTAYETRLNQGTKPLLMATEMLQAHRGDAALTSAIRDVSARAWRGINLYDEHTWGAADTTPGLPHARAQERLKLHNAYLARELAGYLLSNELEALAGNAPAADTQDAVLLVNPTGSVRDHPVQIPDAWWQEGKRLRGRNFGYDQMYDQVMQAPIYGPVQLPPYSWTVVQLAQLTPIVPDTRISVTIKPSEDPPSWSGASSIPASGGVGIIESPYHQLTFDPQTGRIRGLIDRQRDWEVLDLTSPFTLFEFVRERTDALYDDRREAYYDRNMARERADQSCWNTNWKAVRERATHPRGCRVERTALSATLVLEFDAPGVTNLVQRITLRADSPLIELDARFTKEAYSAPEGIYFAFPLNLPSSWRCHFDTSAVVAELDNEQLPRACRDWLTVESFVAMHSHDRGATLYCPDAPMVQVGAFNFGKLQDAIPRDTCPLLLAWPMNNYWNTNFAIIQPGPAIFRYALATHGAFDATKAVAEAHTVTSSVLTHPVYRYDAAAATEGRFLTVTGDDVTVTHMKAATDRRGVIIRLISHARTETQVRLALDGKTLSEAWITSPLEQDHTPLAISADNVQVTLSPRQLTTVRLCVRA